jgi:hypothetical protein
MWAGITRLKAELGPGENRHLDLKAVFTQVCAVTFCNTISSFDARHSAVVRLLWEMTVWFLLPGWMADSSHWCPRANERACVVCVARLVIEQCGVFDVETVRAVVEWGSFTTSLSAPSTIVVINAPGATTAVTARAHAVTTGTQEPTGAVPLTPRDEGAAYSSTEDVSATSIDTSAL